MKRVLEAAVLFVFVFSESAFAEGSSFGSGAGLSTCGEFAKAYKKQPNVIENLFFTWAQGYMTAWNIASNDRILQIDLNVWTVGAQRSHI